jgi:hypothetical protein
MIELKHAKPCELTLLVYNVNQGPFKLNNFFVHAKMEEG